MLSFSEYHDVVALEESLNTPLEFHLTDDTMLPYRVHGVFSIDTDTYGMSLEQSDFEGIYILTFYRILNKQARQWSFKKPAHIRPALSTFLKFAEAAVPFVKNRLRGIICKIPGQNSERYLRFARLMLRKSYIKSFTVLPTLKSPDKKLYNWENMFLARKGVSPASVFNDKKFKKYYDFEGVITHEIVNDIQTKLPSKKTLRTEPSKRYRFQNLDVEGIHADDELFNKITTVVKVKEERQEDDVDVKNLKFVKASDVKYYKAMAIDYPFDKENLEKFIDITNDKTEFLARLLQYSKDTYELTSLRRALADYEKVKFDVDPKDSSNLTKIKDSREKLLKEIIHAMHKTNLHKEAIVKDKMLDLDMESVLDDAISRSRKISMNDLKAFMEVMTLKSDPERYKTETMKTNINVEDLKSNIPGVGELEFLGKYGSLKRPIMKNYHATSIVETLFYNMGYGKEIREMKEFKSLYSYSGKGYVKMNGHLRDVFTSYVEGQPAKINEKSVLEMANAFEKVTPLPKSLWLFRSTKFDEGIADTIEEGGDFMDPAFMSCSVDPNNIEAFSGSKIFRIFVPKDSRVIPILRNSKHVREREVILPPMSVLKVVRIDKRDKETLYSCIFVGSVYKDFLSKIDLKEGYMFYENKKNATPEPKYNAAEKFAGTTNTKTLKAAQEFLKKLDKEKK